MPKKNHLQESPFVEYITYRNKINPDDFENVDIVTFSQPLFSSATSKQEKQKITFIFAHLWTKECLEILKKYYLQEKDHFLKAWTEIAMDECALFAWEWKYAGDDDSDDFERWNVSVMGPSWWLNGKLRMYVWIFKKDEKTITKEEQNLIAKSFLDMANKYDSMLENCDREKDVGIITLLLSIETVPDDAIMNSIDLCNKDNELLLKWYAAENVGYPKDKDIKDARKYLHEQDKKWLLWLPKSSCKMIN